MSVHHKDCAVKLTTWIISACADPALKMSSGPEPVSAAFLSGGFMFCKGKERRNRVQALTVMSNISSVFKIEKHGVHKKCGMKQIKITCKHY